MKIEIPKGDNFVLILAGLNSSQREFIRILCQCSRKELLVHLENFTQWVWEKGDALCWSPVFDRFDTILSEYITRYIDQPNVLDPNIDWLDYRFVEAILKVSIIIVENCTSKNYYNSLDRLVKLLEDISPNIVYLSSRLISIYFSRNKKSNVPKDTMEMMEKLQVLSQNPLPEVTYSDPIESSLSVPPIFDYYIKNRTYTVDPKGHLTIGDIKIPISDIRDDKIKDLLDKYKTHRFELVRKLMILKAASDPQLQKTLVNIRFASLISLLLVNKQVFLQFLNQNPSFIFELSVFISHYKEIDMTSMIVATELLSNLIYDGIQYKALSSVLGFSYHDGLFVTVLKAYLTHNYSAPLKRIICKKSDEDTSGFTDDDRIVTLKFTPKDGSVGESWHYYYNNEEDEMDMSIDVTAREERMNILLQLLIAYLSIVSYHGGAGALVSQPVLELLVGFLKNRDPIAIPVIIYIVQILESLLEYSQPVCQILRNYLSLFSVFTLRIHYDFQKLNKFTRSIQSDYPVESALDLALKMDGKTSIQSKIFFDWWFNLGEKNARTFLFKTILKDLDVFVRSITDFHESLDIFSRDVGILPIVKWVLKHPNVLDLGIYASSLTLLSDTINEDPVALPSLIEYGIIDDLFDSITTDNMKCEDVLSIIPTLVCDLFLHPSGVSAIGSRNYKSIILLMNTIINGEFVLFDRFGEVSSCIGSSIEEIVRNDSQGNIGLVINDSIFEMLERLDNSNVNPPLGTNTRDETPYFERGIRLFGLNEMVEGHHFYADRLANLGKFLLRYYRKSAPIKNFIRQGGFRYIIKLLHSPLLPPLFMHIFPQHPMVTFLRSLVSLSGPHILDLICELISEFTIDNNVTMLSSLCLLYSVYNFHSRESDLYGRMEKSLSSGHPYLEDLGSRHIHYMLGKALIASGSLIDMIPRFINSSHCKAKSLVLSTLKSSIHNHPDSSNGDDKGEMTENDLFWVTQCGFAYSRPNPFMMDYENKNANDVGVREYEMCRITLCKFRGFITLMSKSIHSKWVIDSITPEIYNHAKLINLMAIKLISGALNDEYKFEDIIIYSKYVAQVIDLLNCIHFEDGSVHLLLIYLFSAEGGFRLLSAFLNKLTSQMSVSSEYVSFNFTIIVNYLERLVDWRLMIKSTQSHNVKLLSIDAKSLIKSIFTQLDELEYKNWGDTFGSPECFQLWDSYERAYHQDPSRLESMDKPSPQPTFFISHINLQQLDFQSPSGQAYLGEFSTSHDKSLPGSWKKFYSQPLIELSFKQFSKEGNSREEAYYPNFIKCSSNVFISETLDPITLDGFSNTNGYRKKNSGEFVKRLLEFSHGPRSLSWLVDIFTRLVGITSGSCLSYAIRIIFKDLSKLKKRLVLDSEHNSRLYCIFFTLAHILHRFPESIPICESIDSDYKDLLLYFITKPIELRIEAIRNSKPGKKILSPPHYYLYAFISLSENTIPITLCLDILSLFPSAPPNLVLKCLETIDFLMDDKQGSTDAAKNALQFNNYKPKIHHLISLDASEGVKIRSALHLLYGLYNTSRPRGLLLLLTSITLKALKFKRCKYASVFLRDIIYWLMYSVKNGANEVYALNHYSLAFIIENAVYQYPILANLPLNLEDMDNCYLYTVLLDHYFPLFITSKPTMDAIHHFTSMIGVVAQRVGSLLLSPSIERVCIELKESNSLINPIVIYGISELCERLSLTSSPSSSIILLRALYHIYNDFDKSLIDLELDDPIDYFSACNSLLRAISSLTSPNSLAYRGNSNNNNTEYPYQTEILNVTFTASPICSEPTDSVTSEDQSISQSYSYSESESETISEISVDVDTRLPHEESSESVSSNSEGSDSELDQVPRIRLAGELDGDYLNSNFPDSEAPYQGGSESDSQASEHGCTHDVYDIELLGPTRLLHPSESMVCEFIGHGGFESDEQRIVGGRNQIQLQQNNDNNDVLVNWDGSPDFLIPQLNPGMIRYRSDEPRQSQASDGDLIDGGGQSNGGGSQLQQTMEQAQPQSQSQSNLHTQSTSHNTSQCISPSSQPLAAMAWCLGIDLDVFLECAGMSLAVLDELPSHIRHEIVIQQLGSLNLSGVERSSTTSPIPEEYRISLTTAPGSSYLDALPLAHRVQITRQLFNSGDGVSISSIENITLGVILNGSYSDDGGQRVRTLSFTEERDNSAVEIFTNLVGRSEVMEKIRADMESASPLPPEAPPADVNLPQDAEFIFLHRPPHFVQLVAFVCSCLKLKKQVNKKVIHRIFYNLTINSNETRASLLGKIMQLIEIELTSSRCTGSSESQSGAVFAFRLLQHLRSLQIALPAVTLYLMGINDEDNKRKRKSNEEESMPLETLSRGVDSPLFQSSLPHSSQIISLIYFCLFGESRLRGGKIIQVGMKEFPEEIDKSGMENPSAGMRIIHILANKNCKSLWALTHYGPNQQTYKTNDSLKNTSQQRAHIASICSLIVNDENTEIGNIFNSIDMNPTVLHRLFILFMDISLIDARAGRFLEPFFFKLIKPISEAFSNVILTDSTPILGSPATLLAIVYFGVSFRLVASEYGCSGQRQLDDVLSSTVLHLSEKRVENGDASEYTLNYWVPDCHISVVDFCESHKTLLNDLIKNSPSLLHGGFEALVRLAPFTLSFENKRLYFRQKLKNVRYDDAGLPFTLFPSTSVGEVEQSEYVQSNEVEVDEMAESDDMFRFTIPPRHETIRLNVRREHVFMDSYHQLRNRTSEEMKGKLSVSFIGEEGVDAGGLTREWYSILAREMFNPNYGLFTREGIKSEFNHPNPLSAINPDHLNFFKFIGRVIGKAIYDSHHLDAYFCRSFYKHMLKRKIVMADAESVDPEFYGNLKKITSHKLEDLGLELYFSAEIDEFGKVKFVDLIPNGRNVLVTEENKMEYLRLMCQHKVSSGIQEQLEAFLEGFYQLIPPKLIGIFDDRELELLISGVPTIDLDDLINNTEYVNYSEESPQIRWLWKVLAEIGQDMLASFLQFVTGTSRVPIGGFRYLMGMRGPQRMSIHRVSEAERLPTAHTCFNQLDLPCYPDIDTLRLKLLMAITQGKEGFGFI